MARRLLLDENPLILLPTLAAALGVNEALILQQFNYWVQSSKNTWKGYRWTYNSYSEWKKQFKFLSVPTIGRAIRNLEKKGLLVSEVGPNPKKFDRTKWYRIDFDKFDELFPDDTLANDDGIKLTQSNVSECDEDRSKLTQSELGSNHEGPATYQNEPTIPKKNTAKTSSETNNKEVSSSSKTRPPKIHSRPIFAEMQKVLGFPNKTQKDPIPNYGKEAKAIARMVARGYTETEILRAWKHKVESRGEFVSMVFVNEDIGKNPLARQTALALPNEEELAAQVGARGLN
jgi:hypothetical protein